MTDTDTDTIERPKAAMPDDLHEEVLDFIRDLAAVAGDADAVYRCLQAYCTKRPAPDDRFAGLAATILVTFTECITMPTQTGEQTEVHLPID